MNRGKQTKDKLQLVLDELKVNYVSPVQFENCRTKQGTKLPFDAFVAVNGRVGLVMVDNKDHFVSTDDSELMKQREKDQIRNSYARDNNLSILRIAMTGVDMEMKNYIASFVTALRQSQNNIAFVMLSNPVVYENFYGDNTKPQLGIVQQQEDYSVSSQPQQTLPMIEKKLEVANTTVSSQDVKQNDVKDTNLTVSKENTNANTNANTNTTVVDPKDSGKDVKDNTKDDAKDPKPVEPAKNGGCYVQ